MQEFLFDPLAHRLAQVNSDCKTRYTAGAQVGGHRIVTLDGQGKVIHADHTVPAHAGQICGLTLTSQLANTSVVVCSFGLVYDSGWSWNLANGLPLFLSTNGLFSQTAPTSGFVCKVGHLVSPTQIFIGIHPPTFLI